MTTLKKLIVALKNNNLTLAAAESASAGYFSYLLTKIPGSSKVFKGGVVVYSLESKNKLLGLPWPLLKKSQGVSQEVAILLAKKARQVFKTDLAVSLVGFASPPARGGIKVGTIFMAVADKNGVVSKKIIIKGSRDYVRKKASLSLINFLYKNLGQK